MAFYNGVYETSTTTGTGTYTLAGAFIASGATVSAYQTFAIVGNGNTCYYRAQDNENGGWEEGIGTYTASGTTLARTQVLASSAPANAAVSWVAGTRQVFLVQSAEGFLQFGPSTYGAAYWAGFNNTVGVEILRLTTPGDDLFEIYIEDYIADITAATGTGVYVQTATQAAGALNDPASVTAVYGEAQSLLPSPRTIARVTGGNFHAFASGGGTVTKGQGIFTQITRAAGSTYTTAYAIDAWMYTTTATAGVGTSYGYSLTHQPGALPVATHFAFWSDDITTTPVATNPYFIWFDSPGVFRVKGDGVLAYYNPSFTKYTPGATAFERVVIQWISNVTEIGTEKGTTGGTLRALRLIGAGVQVSATAATGPDASAAFEVDSTTQGLLPPRMTTTQKNAISSPAEGLVVHDSTLHTPWFYNGSAWTAFGGGVWPATLTAHALYAGNGTSAPTAVGPGSTDGAPLVATGSSTDPAFRSTSLKLDSTFGVITADSDAAPTNFNWGTSNWHSVTLTASRTITFTGDVDGGAITIIFKSGGTGAFTPVWPATVKWFGGVAPTLTNVSGHWDLVSIKRESSGNYIGTFSPNYF